MLWNMPLTVEALTPEVLYRLYAARIDRRIRAVLGRDTDREDLVHEVLITVFRRIGTVRDPACLDRWIDQVTLNTLRYTIRQRRLRRHASWDALPEQQAGSVQPNLDARDLAARAIGVIERLPPSEGALLLNHWFTSLSAREIAESSGCSIVTLTRRLFKARNRFEKLARRDPALAPCVDKAALESPAWNRFSKARTRRAEKAVASREQPQEQQF
jgi:RNA polymerase sigma-70 factor (ECF subfamily)